MYNKKKSLFINSILYFSLILAFFTFNSCVTTEQKIYSLFQEDGQIIFLRPTVIDDKNFILRNTNIDVAIKIVDFKITDNNIINYTVFLPENYYNALNDVELFFKTPTNEKIALSEAKILYKDFDKKKNLEVRYSTSLTGDDLKILLKSPEETQIGLRLKDKTNIFSSEEFSQKLYEAGIIINE